MFVDTKEASATLVAKRRTLLDRLLFRKQQSYAIPDLSQPSVKGLIYLLRNKDQWPKTFGYWSYTSAPTCAMGLAQEMWPEHICVKNVETVSAAIGITFHQGSRAFMSAHEGKLFMRFHMVTPDRVADVLERYV